MFTGNLILCDYLTRLHDGKFMLLGLYNSVVVQGFEKHHDFTFFSQVTTEFRGPATGRIRFFRKGEGPECLAPVVDISFGVNFADNPTVLGGATIGEFPFQVTQAHLHLSVDARVAGENVVLPYVAVLSIGEYEIARKEFTVHFIVKPDVTVTRI